MKDRIRLFVTAFLQVCCVSMNVIFISKEKVIMMLLTGFLISLIWTFNVKKVAFGTNLDRFIYAVGAMIGTLVGYYFSRYLISFV